MCIEKSDLCRNRGWKVQSYKIGPGKSVAVFRNNKYLPTRVSNEVFGSGGCVTEIVWAIAELSDLWQHQAATGRPAGTLDGFLLPSEGHNLRAFLEAVGDADICVLEGNGGLFDGTDGSSEDGSTAQVAKLLGAPVCLVLDPCQTGRSAAAMLKGYKAFDSQLRLEAILLSKAADGEHARRIDSALEGAGVAMRVLGAIHKVKTRLPYGPIP